MTKPMKQTETESEQATPLPIYLDCAMCGTSNSFVISPIDGAVGYCFEEQIAWRIKDGTTTDGTRPAKEWTVRESKVPGYSREISIVCGDLGICRMDGAGSSNPEVLSEVRATAWLIVNAVNSYVRQDIADERVREARESAAKVAEVCTCGSGPEWRSLTMRHHLANCSVHIATMIRAAAACAAEGGEEE